MADMHESTAALLRTTADLAERLVAALDYLAEELPTWETDLAAVRRVSGRLTDAAAGAGRLKVAIPRKRKAKA